MSPTTPRVQRQRTQVQSASHPHHGRVSQASRTGTKQGEPEGGKRPLSGTSETSEDDEVIRIKNVCSYIAHNTSKWRLYTLNAFLPQN